MQHIVSTRFFSNPDMRRLAEWTAMMLDAAEPTARLIGCSASAIVAQAALESGWGRAAIGKNLFGIKADAGWNGARQLVTTREVIGGKDIIIKDWFRDYDSFADSVADHFQFLRRNTRYAKCFDPDGSKTDQEYFQALKDAGYATDPNYVSLLCSVQATVETLERQHMTIVGDSAPPAPKARALLYVGCPTGPDVTFLQTKLSMPVTGHYDEITKAAVMKFQASRNLGVDGVVGRDTWGAIGS